MNLLWPKLRLAWLPEMLASAGLGTLIAGLYGIAHDQITYEISPEYFTRLKFAQFRWANIGLPPRVFVVEIGFLATWWVGFAAGWFLARITIPTCSVREVFRLSRRGFLIMLGFGLAGTCAGYLFGLTQRLQPATSGIAIFAADLGITDVPNFVRVAYIHNASYLGGLGGLIVALIYAKCQRSSASPSDIK